MTPALSVRNLRFGYAAQPVFDGLTFDVAPGESVALLGPNGAGKSTLLWCLLGLLKAQGHVCRNGRCAAVFQNPEDQLFMPSLLDDLSLASLNRGAPRSQAEALALESLRAVGLVDLAHRPASRLSLGQRKRAAIALALVQQPDLLILDEPTSELDGRSVRQLAALLQTLPCAKLIASHHLDFVRATATRVLLLDGAHLIADGPAAVILARSDLLQTHGLV